LSPIKPASAIGRLGALATAGQGRGGEATPKSLKVARTFDSIGRRNESLRAQLDAVEFSFRNIELIRSQFYDALGPIDQTLVEIERTKVAHLEAERTRRGFAALIAAAAATALGIGAAGAQVVIQERVMPALLVETIPVAPGPNYHWVPGHWMWSGRWVWNRGHYIVGVVPVMPVAIVETPPPSPGAGWFWVRGHYVWGPGRWVWNPGHWVR